MTNSSGTRHRHETAREAAAKRDERARLMRRATEASVAVALLLVVLKAGAFVMTDAIAVLSSLFDSGLDLLASFVNLIAVRHALQPADREHRFGHGKAEPLAGLGQGAFILGSSVFLVIESTDRLLAPTPIENGAIGIAVSLISIVATVMLTRFQARVRRETDSIAVAADELHYTGDLYLNVGVISTLGLGMLWPEIGRMADPIFGIGVAIFVVYSSWQIFRLSFNMLMDRELPDEDRDEIRRVCREHPEVLGVHDLKTRRAGPSTFIQLHLELDGDMKLRRAHEVAEAVEASLLKAFPGAEVIIHQDPREMYEKANGTA